MSIRLHLPKVTDLRPRITVIGVGGAGGNAVNNMIAAGLSGVNFIVANTDAQALSTSSTENRIQLGTNLTEGMGAGSKPEIGEAAAEEAVDEIRAQVSGSHMLFIAAGMGGGTGTGAAAVIARVARELGVLTVAVVTKPFLFEGQRRLRMAEAGIAQLKDAVDTLIVIPNQNLFRISTERTTFAEAFVLADQVLYSGIACIVDLILKEGLINLDLADVRTVLTGMGSAMMGTGEASGENRAQLAAEEAINNPLLDDISLKGARGLLVSIIGGHDLTLFEVDAAATRVRSEVDPDANIIVGATFDDTLGDRVRVSIVASGMERGPLAAQPDPAARTPSTPTPSRAPTATASTAAASTATATVPSTATAAAASRPTPPHSSLPLPSANTTSEPEPTIAKAPPPLPQSTNPAATAANTAPDNASASRSPASDLDRRLAAALQPGSGYTSQFDGPLPLPPARELAIGGGIPRPRDGVTIEERPPHLPPALPTSAFPPTASRIPNISEFPPIAQHEYLTRTTDYAAANAANAAKPPNIYVNAPPPEPKRSGFLQRFTGAGRARKANAATPDSTNDGDLPGFLARKR